MTAWIKGCESAHCVEAVQVGQDWLVRDSKDPLGPVLRFTADEWEAFTDAVKDGTFD